ncbi:hypothetical protein B0H21DRAFT_766634 [Amylocystis lapponica]|nr:hypothetical protein B0H21DRAFT_766634 [Amylocystis lapponica]
MALLPPFSSQPVPFVPYLYPVGSRYRPITHPCQRIPAWDPSHMAGAKPSVIEDNMTKFERCESVLVRFFNEQSHCWSQRTVALVMENLKCRRPGGGFVQTYVVCYTLHDRGVLHYAHVIPYLGEVWPLDTPEPLINEAQYKKRRDDLRTVYVQIPTQVTSPSLTGTKELPVAYKAIVEHDSEPLLEIVMTICVGPYKGKQYMNHKVLPGNEQTEKALQRKHLVFEHAQREGLILAQSKEQETYFKFVPDGRRI